MAGTGGGWTAPTLTPVGRGDRTAALLATGLLTAILALVGISLVDHPGGGPGSQTAIGGPTATVKATVAVTARPTVRPSQTAVREPPPGTPPPRVAVSVGPVRPCPPGSTPDVPGPTDQARPPTGSVSMAFDRAAARIILLGQRGESGPVETWTFDVCTNVWTQMHPAKEPDDWAMAMVAYDAGADRTITFPGMSTTRGWAYDLASDTWAETAYASGLDGPVRLVYDPVGGGVVALRLWSARRMLRYDAKADVWGPIAQDRYPLGDEYPFHILLAYDASVDRFVGYELGEVRLFDSRTGTWSAPGSPSPPFSYGGYGSFGGEIAYDEAAQRTILFSGGIVIAYDAGADRWETLSGKLSTTTVIRCATRPECRMNHSMVYDPVNERLVVYGGYVLTGADTATSDDVLAFDARSREWTVLLAASDGQTTQP